MFQLVGSRMWDATDCQMYPLISHEKLYVIHLGLLERDLKLKVQSKYPLILKLSFGLIPKIWMLKTFTFDLSSQNMADPHGLNF